MTTQAMVEKVQAIFWRKKAPKKVGQRPVQPERSSSSLSKRAPTTFMRFSIKEQVLFAKRLSFLIKAGVSVVESIRMIRNQTKSKRKQRVFDTIIEDVNSGHYLSRSLGKYPQLFGEFTINMIRIGESAGVLSENLAYLAIELEKKHSLMRKVYGALVYPIFITVATLGVTGLLVVYIFPKIMPIFLSLNVDIPLTTRALLAISEFLADWGFVTLLGVVVLFVIFFALRKFVYSFRKATDWMLMELPVAGSLARSYNCANFCRTLGLNIRSGVIVSEALRITADVTKNLLYKEAYLDFAAHVTKGEKISTGMFKYKRVFPAMLPNMILIGETTGSLSDTLGYLSELYETEVDEATKNLSNSIEPILLMTMGVLVGLIAVSVIAPIYEVTKAISDFQ